jgi:hypothetical protein
VERYAQIVDLPGVSGQVIGRDERARHDWRQQTAEKLGVPASDLFGFTVLGQFIERIGPNCLKQSPAT